MAERKAMEILKIYVGWARHGTEPYEPERLLEAVADALLEMDERVKALEASASSDNRDSSYDTPVDFSR
jgi:hypothetical protein